MHPHEKAIEKMNASSLIRIIDESKTVYVRENLSIHLHESQIKLLKNVKKHSKPHHAKIRIKQYEKAQKTDLFNLHLDLYLKKYKQLEAKGLILVDLKPENGLPYDLSLTDYGMEILSEIDSLENDWASEVNINDDDNAILKRIALDSFKISYNHKKKQGFIF